MHKYTYQQEDFPSSVTKDLWRSYWVKPNYFHYQVRLPVHYSTTLEEFKDAANHYQLCSIMLTYGFAKLPILNAWFQLEQDKTYDHWQCHLVCYKPIDTQLVRLMMYPECCYKINIYVRVARDPWDSVGYATKIRSRVLGPYFYTAQRLTAKCTRCDDIGCFDCSAMSINALEKP